MGGCETSAQFAAVATNQVFGLVIYGVTREHGVICKILGRNRGEKRSPILGSMYFDETMINRASGLMSIRPCPHS